MAHETVVHETITIARDYAASPTRLFAAWEDAEARRRWGAPFEGCELRCDAADFREGGEDRCVGLQDGAPSFEVETRYLDIRRDARIVLTEAISSDGARQGVSLVTAEFAPAPKGARLSLTIQVAALDGSGLECGVGAGWEAALAAIDDEVAEAVG